MIIWNIDGRGAPWCSRINVKYILVKLGRSKPLPYGRNQYTFVGVDVAKRREGSV